MAEEDILTKDRLSTPEAVLTLGAIAVRSLEASGMAVFFINLKGAIQICPIEEIQLDAHSEEEAISVLLAQGKPDEDIVAYLKDRSARLSRGGIRNDSSK